MTYFVVELHDDGRLGRVVGPLKKGDSRGVVDAMARATRHCFEVEMEDGGTVEAGAAP